MNKRELFNSFVKSYAALVEDMENTIDCLGKKQVLTDLIKGAERSELWDIWYWLSEVGYYTEDKRKIRDFALNVVNNCYIDYPSSVYEERINHEIENAIFNALHKDKEEYFQGLDEALELHDVLNPVLWENEALRSDVASALLKIANTFVDGLGFPLNVVDIRIVGSNASYNYNKDSDIDLHIITNFELNYVDDIILQQLYNNEKNSFNNKHDIKVKGIPVELYVEDIRSMNATNGSYSLLDNSWIKFPQPMNYTIPDYSVELEEELDRAEEALLSDSSQKIKEEINHVYLMRRDGLASEGEVSKGNLVFKELRNMGILKTLAERFYELESIELSLESEKLAEYHEYFNLVPQIGFDGSDEDSVNYWKEQIKKGNHRPILINTDKEILDGNHTMKAYQDLEVEPPYVYLGTREDFYKHVANTKPVDALVAIKDMIADGSATLLEVEHSISKVLYHLSSSYISEFSDSYFGKNTLGGLTKGDGVYFVDNTHNAMTYYRPDKDCYLVKAMVTCNTVISEREYNKLLNKYDSDGFPDVWSSSTRRKIMLENGVDACDDLPSEFVVFDLSCIKVLSCDKVTDPELYETDDVYPSDLYEDELSDKYNIFQQIKGINKNAKYSSYKKMSVNQMLAVLQYYRDNADKYRSISNDLKDVSIPKTFIGLRPLANNNFDVLFNDGSSKILNYKQARDSGYLDYQDLNDEDREQYDLDHLDEDDFGYHYGDLGKGRDTFRANMDGSNRSTGHLGTGTYFLSKPNNDPNFSRADREVKTVDFSKYNLYKPKDLNDIDSLYDFLKSINNHDFEAFSSSKELSSILNNIESADESNLAQVLDDSYKMLADKGYDVRSRDTYYKYDYDYRNAKPEDDGWYKQYLSYWLEDAIENYNDIADRFKRSVDNLTSNTQISDSQYSQGRDAVFDALDKDTDDSLSTIFMKSLGYEGVDVREIPQYDNTEHGSVIYDLKESIKGDTLNEADLLDILNKARSETPKRVRRSQSLYSEYTGLDSDGTIMFHTDSQTRAGHNGHDQFIFYEGFFDLLDKVDAGEHISQEDVLDIITGDVMIRCTCEDFLYGGFAYMSWNNGYGLQKELRAPDVRNPNREGSACKHCLSVLNLINQSNTLFDTIAKDLDALFQRYKKMAKGKAKNESQILTEISDLHGDLDPYNLADDLFRLTADIEVLYDKYDKDNSGVKDKDSIIASLDNIRDFVVNKFGMMGDTTNMVTEAVGDVTPDGVMDTLDSIYKEIDDLYDQEKAVVDNTTKDEHLKAIKKIQAFFTKKFNESKKS